MLDEKDRLTDSLITQKYIASGYNKAASESANSQLMDTFISIMRDEHQIQHEIFSEMKNRGWYQPKMANMSDLNQHMNKWTQDYQRVQQNIQRPQATQQANYQTGFQTSVPQYGFQTGVGMPQTASDPAQQPMYRPPQNPMI